MSWLVAPGAALIGVVLATLLYRWIFALAYLIRGSGVSPALAGPPGHRFAVLVPAHDEEVLIGELIGSIRSADYPPQLVEIVVVADHCSDATAARARALGATVLERSGADARDRGKGQALAFGLDRIDLTRHDAVAFVDADNLVDPSFFRAMSRELAHGREVLQGYDGLSNPGQSALTRLIHVTSVMKNLLFCAGKAALGIPTLLMGTGMVFARGVLERVPWSATSVGEDLEQSFHLRELGIPIWFVADARVYAQEAVNLRQGTSQRQRWATGRQAARRRALVAMADGLRRGDWALVDAGIEILIPTYSMTLNLTGLALLLALAAGPSQGLLFTVLLVVAIQMAEVGVALHVMKAGPEYLRSFAMTPIFLVWKGVIDLLAAFGHGKRRWTRTERNAGSPR